MNPGTAMNGVFTTWLNYLLLPVGSEILEVLNFQTVVATDFSVGGAKKGNIAVEVIVVFVGWDRRG